MSDPVEFEVVPTPAQAPARPAGVDFLAVAGMAAGGLTALAFLFFFRLGASTSSGVDAFFFAFFLVLFAFALPTALVTALVGWDSGAATSGRGSARWSSRA